MIDQVIPLVREAGRAIMAIYEHPRLAGQVDYKGDDSPLTLADRAANKVLVEGLRQLFPDIPILSEEEKHQPYEVRQHWSRFWLVDPLDGTREFINRNGEFTVNIALIEQELPVAGVIYVPARDALYRAEGRQAWKETASGRASLQVRQPPEQRVAVRSKSHASPEEEEEVLRRYRVGHSISVGSSLKFCLVAEGQADVYYRHGPTMEWDTAAGQAVVQAAGGFVYAGHEPGRLFRYNKENLLNSSFLCLGFQDD